MSSADVKRIIKELKRQGWNIVSQNSHIKMRSPGGTGFVSISSSPSCGYFARNVRKEADKIMKQESLKNTTTQENQNG